MQAFIELLKIIFIGIVEGITEWLPISSTGHMIIVDEIIKLNFSDEFKEMFMVVIQLGAIIAVVHLYFSKLWPFSKNEEGKIEVKKNTVNMWLKVIVACIPAVVIGFFADDFLDKYFYNPVVVAIMLIAYGIWFIIIENKNKDKKPKINKMSKLDYKTAFFIGLFQVLALIPGTSRSGATIIGGLTLGVSRQLAATFTFFLGIPIMFGASFLKIVKYGLHFKLYELAALLLGMTVAYGVSVFAIKFLMQYIKKHDFKVFGYYRIGLGVVILLFFGIKALIAG